MTKIGSAVIRISSSIPLFVQALLSTNGSDMDIQLCFCLFSSSSSLTTMFRLIVFFVFFIGFVENQELIVNTDGISSMINGFISQLNLTDNITSIVDSTINDINVYFGSNSILDAICNIPDLFSNVTAKCASQIEVLCHEAEIGARMYDASAKFPYSGMNFTDRTVLGNYDECMAIDYHKNGTRGLGKYCVAGLIIPDFNNITNIDLVHKLDLCIPDGCSANDLTSIGQTINPNLPLVFLDDFCSTKGSGNEFKAANIVVIFFFLAVVLMMILSTAYEIYLYKNEQKTFHPLLLAFSIFSNGKKLFSPTNYSKDRIDIFDGLKVISMMWIIAGHGFGTYISGTFSVLNKEAMDSFHGKRYSGYIDAAHVAVDTFVFISGFLLSYHYLKDNSRSTRVQLKMIPFNYMHRLLRITPPVLMMYLSTMFIFSKLGSGPFWEHGNEIHLKPCREYWWSYILFIQNYVNYDNLCLVPHWYLSVDIQCFILSPLFLIPTSRLLRKSDGFKYSMIFLSILNVICIVLPMVIWVAYPEYKNEYGTHSRLTDFLIGITMGVYMRTKKDAPFLRIFDRRKIEKLNIAIWMIVLVGMFTVLFFYQDAEMNQGFVQRLFYFGLSRPAWCILLCWVVYSCHHGYGGIVNWILTGPIFQFGSKLAYCMYIVHYTVIGHYGLSNRMKWYFSDYVQFYLWCGYFMETLLWALFWTLAFESPILVFEKYLFRRPAKVKEETTKATIKATC